MADLILHHYDASPYAEKIRLILGYKGLPWKSVKIPRIMPKPDLMPLTGGYRRTPVLQIGADIYCDTERIAGELERRHPTPTLFAQSEGLSRVIGNWVAMSFFGPAAFFVIGSNADQLPMEFHEDRAAMRGRKADVAASKANAPRFRERVRAQLAWLESMLSDGREFLLGDKASLADFSAYHPVWFILRNGFGQDLAPFPKVSAWARRVEQFGHGRPEELDSKQALRIARESTPAAAGKVDAQDRSGLKAGDKVAITAEDTGRDPVVGVLVSSSANEIAILREDETVGEVAVHFPRVGYDVRRVE